MTVTSVESYSASRPHIVVPPAAGGLLPEERATVLAKLPNRVRVRVPAIPESVPRIRHVVRKHVLAAFAADPESPGEEITALARRVETIASGLATNALRNMLDPKEPIVVVVSVSKGDRFPRDGWARRHRTPAAVTLCVKDDNPQLPPEVIDDSESGRGLLIVHMEADYADAVPTPSGGKNVRALVLIPPSVWAWNKKQNEGGNCGE